MRHPRRRASRRKIARLFFRGWPVRMLARWYGVSVADVEAAIRRNWR